MAKKILFLGTSRAILRSFAPFIRKRIGIQLDRLETELEPDDWKPMSTIGAGVREIRIRDESGAYRVIYVAKFTDAIYVLHAFQKKTQKTDKRDIELATKRYRELLQEIRK